MTILKQSLETVVKEGLYQLDDQFVLPQAEAMFGGYVMALAYRVASKHAIFEHPLHQSCHFMGPLKHNEPIYISVETLKASSRFHILDVVFSGKRPLFRATYTFAKKRDSSYFCIKKKWPKLVPIQECVPFIHPKSEKKHFFNTFNFLLEPSCKDFMYKTKNRMQVSGYFVAPKGDVFSLLDIPFLCDAIPPVPHFKYGAKIGWMPSLNLDLQFRAPVHETVIKCVVETKYISSGVAQEDCLLISEDDKLLALSRQMMMMPS